MHYIIDTIKKAFFIWLGSVLIIIGLVSLLFPFIPGFILIFLGFILCAKGSDRLAEWRMRNKLLNNIEQKLFRLKNKIYRAKEIKIFNLK